MIFTLQIFITIYNNKVCNRTQFIVPNIIIVERSENKNLHTELSYLKKLISMLLHS